MIQLRDDQADFVAGIGAALARHTSVLGQAPTGSGKTVCGAFLARAHHQSRKGVIFAVHRRSLITQTSATFRAFGISHGTIAQGVPYDSRASVHVASIETLRRRMTCISAPSLLVVDECHMAASKTWAEVIRSFRERGSRILGLSATPTRLDGKSLGDLFDVMVPGPSVRWLMDQGHLSDYVAFTAPPDGRANRAGLKKRAGEFRAEEAEAEMGKRAIVGCAIEHYRAHADGMRSVCYCVSIRHARDMAAAFTAAGIPSAAIDSETPRDEQQRLIGALADGAIRVLTNCELITTGFDLSAQVGRDVPIEAVIALRPTASTALWLQMVGRGLRAKPRPAVILDHAGNFAELGFPDDDREWSLEPPPKLGRSRGDGDVAVRECPECYCAHRPAPQCPNCGHVYPVVPRQIEQRDGELMRVERGTVTGSPARSLDDWVRVGRARSDVRNPYAFARRMMEKHT